MSPRALSKLSVTNNWNKMWPAQRYLKNVIYRFTLNAQPLLTDFQVLRYIKKISHYLSLLSNIVYITCEIFYYKYIFVLFFIKYLLSDAVEYSKWGYGTYISFLMPLVYFFFIFSGREVCQNVKWHFLRGTFFKQTKRHCGNMFRWNKTHLNIQNVAFYCIFNQAEQFYDCGLTVLDDTFCGYGFWIRSWDVGLTFNHISP